MSQNTSLYRLPKDPQIAACTVPDGKYIATEVTFTQDEVEMVLIKAENKSESGESASVQQRTFRKETQIREKNKDKEGT